MPRRGRDLLLRQVADAGRTGAVRFGDFVPRHAGFECRRRQGAAVNLDV